MFAAPVHFSRFAAQLPRRPRQVRHDIVQPRLARLLLHLRQRPETPRLVNPLHRPRYAAVNTVLRLTRQLVAVPPVRHPRYRETDAGGDWLTQSGLLTPPFSIEALPGRIIIRAEPGVILA
nr:hypothetical protein [Dickeya dadantii]